ncbi:MAG TPA: hypothetical protein VGC72_09965 [Candidatus Elarobacter sp.]|jgi:hypothetical protein
MLAAAAVMLFFQVTPLPTDSATPTPAATATASPTVPAAGAGTTVPPDCMHYADSGCPFDTRKRPAESACVRAARSQERCAQQTSGFLHYLNVMRAGTIWGFTAGWLDHRTGRGHLYAERARQIFVQLAHDPAAPGSISDVARTTLIKMYGTDRPTASTPFVADRRRTPPGRLRR